MTDKLTYEVKELEDKRMTQVLAFSDKYPNGILVAFWNWRLTGRQGAYQTAVALRTSRQRMADAGKPVSVEAELLRGPFGSGKPLKIEETTREQYAMKLEGK